MQAFDASSIIHAWDNYPVDQFPPLWNWISTQIEAGIFVIPKVAFEEVEHMAFECAEWMKDKDILRIEMTNEIVQEALRIIGVLGIKNNKYHAKGVDENDVLIIATARIQEAELVSEEGKQTKTPESRSKMKIPAVCNLDEVKTPCLNFIELIKRSKVVFR